MARISFINKHPKVSIKKEKKKKESGYCYDCKFAYLMQSRKENPIVSECRITKERQVAKVYLCTSLFEELEGEKVIHEMIKAK